MKKAVLISLVIVVVLYIAAVLVPFDPEERRPGTRLSGALADPQTTDWAFLDGRQQMYLETRPWYLVRHSITVMGWARDGQLYVGCLACDGKVWPRNVVGDPRVRIRFDGKIYQRRAVQITDPGKMRSLISAPQLPPGFALYRMEPL